MPDRVPSEARVTPLGSGPDSVKVIGVSPLAVTAKVPVWFSAKVVELPEVKTSTPLFTVKVKDWVDVFELASVAVMVIG